MDILPSDRDADLPSFRARIVSVVLGALADEYRCIAIRGDRLLLEGHVPLRHLPEPGADTPFARDRAVVLITGGLGGVGLALAESLAAEINARVALLSRRSINDLENAGDSTTIEVKAALARMNASGGEVMMVVGDVTDPGSLRKARMQIEARWGDIHAVVHAAGHPGGALIRNNMPGSIKEVAGPKIVGMTNLVRVFQDCDLDFFAPMSSLSTEVGAIGQADYCAANLVLNEYAGLLCRRHGWHAVAIGWDRWDGIGMARHAPVGLVEERPGLGPVEAAAAFRDALARDMSTVFVSKGGWWRQTSRPADETAADKLSGPLDREAITSALIEKAREVLEMEEIGVDVDLFDLGADSIDLIELFHVADQMAPNRISIHEVLLHPSIENIVSQIVREKPRREASPDAAADPGSLNVVTLDL
jgi:NADP-dependent 3-hydroxy acid dehydrogenase YdfG